jgi:hypothetical protein
VTARLVDSLPASVELAAGSGKTWTLSDTVRTIAAEGGRALVLTHTIAGVHALSAKLHEFEIDPAAYHVATITSFAIEVVCAYSELAGFDVPAEVDLSRSNDYLHGAAATLGRKHIRDVYAISFSHLLVDEYQDCTQTQHKLILAIRTAIPATAVFGDRLQGIFGFAGRIVDWEADVLPEFPDFSMPQLPRRWDGHNEDLGAWLLRLRPELVAGRVFDMSSGLPGGVSYRPNAQRWALINAARDVGGPGESVVVITGPAIHAPRSVASVLRGYTAMEEIGGSFMAKHLAVLTELEPGAYAGWLANLAKKCFTGYGELDKPVLDRLARGPQGKPVTQLRRSGLERTLLALDRVRVAPTLEAVANAMDEIRRVREAQLHSREAWHDISTVIDSCSVDEERDLVAELGHVRDRVRYGGRGHQLRVVSRTVLIKGLEFDHVIVANIADISDASNLYVALSRARKTITIIGPSPQVTIKETKTG